MHAVPRDEAPRHQATSRHFDAGRLELSRLIMDSSERDVDLGSLGPALRESPLEGGRPHAVGIDRNLEHDVPYVGEFRFRRLYNDAPFFEPARGGKRCLLRCRLLLIQSVIEALRRQAHTCAAKAELCGEMLSSGVVRGASEHEMRGPVAGHHIAIAWVRLCHHQWYILIARMTGQGVPPEAGWSVRSGNARCVITCDRHQNHRGSGNQESLVSHIRSLRVGPI